MIPVHNIGDYHFRSTLRNIILRTSLSIALMSLVSLIANSPATAAEPAGDWTHMQSITPRGYGCGRAQSPLDIDGKLDESAWQAAPWTDEFVDIEGDKRPKPRLTTRAKMLWDDQYFYIAAELKEPHVWATLTEHDAVIFQDNDFEVFVDPDGDNHDYFEFEINALNTGWDLYLPKPYKDGGSADNGWEIIGLKKAVHVSGTLNEPSDTDEGWTVELAIPWSAFQPPLAKDSIAHKVESIRPKNGDRWRVDFSRVEWQHEVVEGKYRKVAGTKEDNWVWSPQGIIDMHRPERWGYVQFVDAVAGQAELSKLAYQSDPALPLRDQLMNVYHRQRQYKVEHGRWAKSLQDLGIDNTELSLIITGDDYRASGKLVVDEKTQVWNVRQDSKLWRCDLQSEVDESLKKAGKNAEQLRQALDAVTTRQRAGLEFLIAHMPQVDLESLSAEFLVSNVREAYETLDAAPWRDSIPQDIFFNNVLPYASINERRDNWRSDFRKRFSSLIKEAKTPGHAAALLNQRLYPMVKVKYSTQRKKADQSPYESLNSGLASCTGLSVLLIDACRAVGVPARFVGTPLWTDNSGNHSWTEVWDNGWHFTGAAEPSGDQLDQAWFIDRASKARRDEPMHAIYAVSYAKTPLKFPMVWARDADYIHAVNVTDRYTQLTVKAPEGMTKVWIRAVDQTTGKRVPAKITIAEKDGSRSWEGISNDERFDANDHLGIYLPTGAKVSVTANHEGRSQSVETSVAENTTVTVGL